MRRDSGGRDDPSLRIAPSQGARLPGLDVRMQNLLAQVQNRVGRDEFPGIPFQRVRPPLLVNVLAQLRDVDRPPGGSFSVDQPHQMFVGPAYDPTDQGSHATARAPNQVDEHKVLCDLLVRKGPEYACFPQHLLRQLARAARQTLSTSQDDLQACGQKRQALVVRHLAKPPCLAQPDIESLPVLAPPNSRCRLTSGLYHTASGHRTRTFSGCRSS